MNIIEKLGIRRLEIFSTVSADGNIKVRFADLLEKETVYNEMLEALIKTVNDWHIARTQRLNYNMSVDYFDGIKGMIANFTDIIEKATGKTWEEIQEIINEERI